MARRDAGNDRDTDQEQPHRVSPGYVTAGLAVCLTVFALFTYVPAFRRIELNTLDMRYRIRRAIHVSPRLATVDIDAATIERAGEWPVPRTFYADVIQTLADYDARLISFDILFPDASPPSADRGRLAKALELSDDPGRIVELRRLLAEAMVSPDDDVAAAIRESGIVILPQTFATADQLLNRTREAVQEETLAARERMTADRRSTLALLQDFSLHCESGKLGGDPLTSAYDIEPPYRRFAEHAAGVGFAQVVQDLDGTVRTYPLFMRYDGRLYPSLAIMGVSIAVGVPLNEFDIKPGRYVLIPGARVYSRDGYAELRDIRIPVDDRVRMMVNWAGDYLTTFEHIPAAVLLRFRAVQIAKMRIHRYADDLDGLISHGYAEAVADITARRLLDAADAELMVRDLLLAQLAESMSAAVPNSRQAFLDGFAGGDDSDMQQHLAGIWDQVVQNRELLNGLRETPDASYEALIAEAGVTADTGADSRHAAEFLRFIVKAGRDPERWRPLYFFPPQEIAISGSGRRSALSPFDLAGKVFYVGLTATGTHDFNPRYPMVGLHVNAANSLLTGQFIRPLTDWGSLLLMVVLALVTVCSIPRLQPVTGTLLMVCLMVSYVVLCFVLFDREGLWLPMLAPLGAILVPHLMIVTHKVLLEQREKRSVRHAFSTYMTPAVVNQVLKDPAMLRLGGQRREMSVYFSDLAGFTSISEAATPEELVQLLNEYLEGMTGVIFDHGGTLDKYAGDGVMAFWGAPVPQDDHAYRCCCAALDAQYCLREVLLPKWTAEGRPQLRMRIGINSGPMVVGNMGSRTRMDYTVMGDAVNLGARLETANKEYGTATMISEFTWNWVKDRLVCRELDALRVMGKVKPVRVYELVGQQGDVSPDRMETIERFEAGLRLYREREWRDAMAAFSTILRGRPDDGPSRTLLKRCEVYVDTPPPLDWDGVFSLDSK
jgi:class 3 adenylate cyclase/CHASE2 domain-containing sensor protein